MKAKTRQCCHCRNFSAQWRNSLQPVVLQHTQFSLEQDAEVRLRRSANCHVKFN
jgi:hypothetical protein